MLLDPANDSAGTFSPEELKQLATLSHQLSSAAAVARALGFARIEAALATIMRAPFELSNANELSRLVAAAGFLDIAVQRSVGAVEFPSVERFVLSYVAGSPLASHVSQASDVVARKPNSRHQVSLRETRRQSRVIVPDSCSSTHNLQEV
ncbi:hypothetical protein MTX20_03825 [Bradyrhizobium sp. ISRA435]|nr:hypothetical protein MTX20_03825 [Bradyrhizobium sp. ISRA435]